MPVAWGTWRRIDEVPNVGARRQTMLSRTVTVAVTSLLLLVYPSAVSAAPPSGRATEQGVTAEPGRQLDRPAAHVPNEAHHCSGDFLSLKTPDSVFGVYDFGHACGHHDICYSWHYMTGRSKSDCDGSFLNEMNESCFSMHVFVWNGIPIPINPFLHLVCTLTANTYAANVAKTAEWGFYCPDRLPPESPDPRRELGQDYRANPSVCARPQVEQWKEAERRTLPGFVYCGEPFGTVPRPPLLSCGPVPQPAQPQPLGPENYTVQPGDSMWGIARRVVHARYDSCAVDPRAPQSQQCLGWVGIYEREMERTNPQILSITHSFNTILPGMRLFLPAFNGITPTLPSFTG